MESRQLQKVGRPSSYSPEVASYICEQLKTGRSLKSVCRDKGMPCPETVWGWLNNSEFFAQYAHAKEISYHQMAEDVLEIADDTSINWNDRRLMVDTRKWFLSKCLPKIYGDRLHVEKDITHTHLVGMPCKDVTADGKLIYHSIEELSNEPEFKQE